ncbi:MAG: hypothetical protein ACOC41_02005 [Chitinivibrionales bacterium]
MKTKNFNFFRFITFLLCLSAAVFGAEEKKTPLVLRHADFNQNTMRGGKLISELEGNVDFQFGDTRISSTYAKWYRSDGIIQFRDGVFIDMPDQTLSCDRLHFYRDRMQVTASGNVDYFDKKRSTRVLAPQATYHLEKESLELIRNPQLIRYDTTDTDTLNIISTSMHYDDSTGIAAARGSVKITRGPLVAYSQIAYYHSRQDMARLRKDPEIFYDIHHVEGDSIDLFFDERLLTGVSVDGDAHAIHRDPPQDLQTDTIITDIVGDSLYMAINPEGRIDTTWVHGNAISKYYRVDEKDQTNEARGKMMALAFDEGKAHHLTISGNAESIYYIQEDGKDSGRNIADGQKIEVAFRDGRAVFLTMTGDVRGKYFARQR